MTTEYGAGPAEVRLPPHDHHRDVAGSALRPALFGGMDGIVSNTSLLAGVAGGGGSGHTVLLAGLAGLIAGAGSMAVGEYTSVRTQREATLAEVSMERLELGRSPQAEQAELAKVYRDLGLDGELANTVAAQVMASPDTALRVHTQQELGVDIDRLPSPWTAGLSSLAAFAIGAFVPVLPYAVGWHVLPLALALAGVALFIAGAFASRYTARPLLLAGLRQLVLGAAATGLTYGAGLLIGHSTS